MPGNSALVSKHGLGGECQILTPITDWLLILSLKFLYGLRKLHKMARTWPYNTVCAMSNDQDIARIRRLLLTQCYCIFFSFFSITEAAKMKLPPQYLLNPLPLYSSDHFMIFNIQIASFKTERTLGHDYSTVLNLLLSTDYKLLRLASGLKIESLSYK